MEILNGYVVTAIMAICLAVGFILKHAFTALENRWIPLIWGVLGVVLNIWTNSWVFTPDILLGGLASGLASTGAFELVRNVSKKQ